MPIFFQKLKFFFQIIIIFVIGSMAIYSVSRVLLGILTTPQKQPNPNSTANNKPAQQPKDFVKRAKLHWEKNQFVLPHEFFLPVTEQKEFKLNDNYFLIQRIQGKEKQNPFCYFGKFKLMASNYDHFIFSSGGRAHKRSKLGIYAELHAKSVLFQILDSDQFSQRHHMKSCANWIQTQNQIELNLHTPAPQTHPVLIPMGKCLTMQSNQYVSMVTHNSQALFFRENPVKGKMDLCALKPGVSLIEIQSVEGETNSFLAESVLTKKKSNQKGSYDGKEISRILSI